MKRSQKTRQLHSIKALYLRCKRWTKPEQVSPRFRESDEELRQSDTNYSNRGCIWYPKELGYSDILCKADDDFYHRRTLDGKSFRKIALDKDKRDMRYSYIDCKNLGLVRRRRQEALQNVDDWKSQVDDWHVNQYIDQHPELWSASRLYNADHWEYPEGWDDYDLDDNDEYCYDDYQSLGYDDDYESCRWRLCIDSAWDDLETAQLMIDGYWMSDNSSHLFPNNEWTPAPTSIPDSPFADKF